MALCGSTLSSHGWSCWLFCCFILESFLAFVCCYRLEDQLDQIELAKTSKPA